MLIISYPIYKTVYFKNQNLIKDPNRKKRKIDYLVVVPVINILRNQHQHRPHRITLLHYLVTLLLHRYYIVYLVFMTRLYWLIQILVFSSLEVHCYKYVASVYFKDISGLSPKRFGVRKGGNSGNMFSNNDSQFSFRTELFDLDFSHTTSLIKAVGYLPKGSNSLRVKFNQTYTVSELYDFFCFPAGTQRCFNLHLTSITSI